MSTDVRAAAARGLGAVLGGKSLEQALPPLLEAVASRDRPLLQQLCYGTLRLAPRLQGLLELLLDRPLRGRDLDVQGLLLCGLYQLEATRIPDHAAVAATVDAAGHLHKRWARGLANAVLRRFLRERAQLIARLDDATAAAHPRWLYHKLGEQWPRHRDEIVDAGNRQPPMTLRVNRARTGRDAYLARLAERGIGARPGDLSPQAVYLDTPMDVDQLVGFSGGEVSVQDEAAQLAAPLLGVQAGERVLDACAAPGGKTCHILELQPRLGELVAMDSDPGRLSRVADNLERLGLRATLVAGDAGDPPPVLARGSFDRILVDAPCSATGVIRRHPDIKLLRREADIAGFARQQLRLLGGLWPMLRSGGRLLYATCSVLKEENGRLIAQFLADCPGAGLLPLEVPWGEATGGGVQLLPTPGGPDGLFYALLEKRG